MKTPAEKLQSFIDDGGERRIVKCRATNTTSKNHHLLSSSRSFLKISELPRSVPSRALFPNELGSVTESNPLNLQRTAQNPTSIPLTLNQRDAGIAQITREAVSKEPNKVYILSSPEGFRLSHPVGPKIVATEVPKCVITAGPQLDQAVRNTLIAGAPFS